MRDRLVGDIGDFGKFGLLRHITGMKGGPRLRLGVIWYFNPGGLKGGNLTDYLQVQNQLAGCDPFLHRTLGRLVGQGIRRRRVSEIQSSGVLHFRTAYFRANVPPNNPALRHDWLKLALLRVAGVDLVFVDPDIGIAHADQRDFNFNVQLAEETESPEHLSLGELQRFYNKGKSLIIHQDLSQGLDSRETVDDRIKTILACLDQGLQPANRIWALRWNRGVVRAFFVVVHPNDADVLNPQVQAFVDNRNWFVRQRGFRSAHFQNVQLNP